MRVFIFVLLFGLLVKKLKMLKIPPNDSAKNNVLNNCEANSKRDTHLRSLFQGDIAIEDDLKRDTNKGQDDIAYAFVKSETRIWLGGHVPYTFKPFVFPNGNTEPVFRNSTKDMIKKGLQHISEMVPCLTFRESNRKDEHKLIFTIQSDAKHPDDKNGCWSYVGKTTTSVDKDGEHGQVINLGNRKCFNIGTVIHEVLHSLGANHEQNNPNRNSYINILWKNIDPRACNEFMIADPTMFGNYDTDYDVDSIMHYDLTMGSKPPGNLTTMELKDKTKIIIPPSKKTSMSITDIIELGRVYENYTYRSCFTQDNLDKYSDHITKVCQAGWERYGSSCFRVFNDHVTWRQAQDTCQREYGTLASILDSTTNKGVTSLIRTIPNCKHISGKWYCDRMWIGLFRPGRDSTWEWVDKTSLNYEGWGRGKSGDGNCAEIITKRNGAHDHGWNDLNCNSTRSFVCQKPVNTFTTTTTTTSNFIWLRDLRRLPRISSSTPMTPAEIRDFWNMFE